MRIALAVVTLIWLACQIGSVSAEPEAYTEPRWLVRPQAELFSLMYPADALVQRVEGRVILDCLTRPAQRVECGIVSETPNTWRFGEAAVAMSRSFRLAPATRAGREVLGTSLRIPIAFRAWAEAPDEELELPAWEAAPNAEDVRAAWGDAARLGGRARGVLSCLVKDDRGLDCQLVRETPENLGVGVAALALASAFAVAEGSAAFVEEHRTARFILPINFGFASQFEPVGVGHEGLGPIDGPPPPQEVIDAIYPAAARAQGVDGTVGLTCTLRSVPPAQCEIENEQPTGWGFGLAAVEAFEQVLSAPDDSPFMLGDQVRFDVQFTARRRP